MKNGDGVGEMQASAPWKARRSELVDYALHMEQLGDCSGHAVMFAPFLPGGTTAGDMARGTVVVAAGGWNRKQSGGRGYKSSRN